MATVAMTAVAAMAAVTSIIAMARPPHAPPPMPPGPGHVTRYHVSVETVQRSSDAEAESPLSKHTRGSAESLTQGSSRHLPGLTASGKAYAACIRLPTDWELSCTGMGGGQGRRGAGVSEHLSTSRSSTFGRKLRKHRKRAWGLVTSCSSVQWAGKQAPVENWAFADRDIEITAWGGGVGVSTCVGGGGGGVPLRH
jgi:hypothetical protein